MQGLFRLSQELAAGGSARKSVSGDSRGDVRKTGFEKWKKVRMKRFSVVFSD